MLFYLTVLHVAYILDRPCLEGNSEFEPALTELKDKFDADDDLCKGYILSAFSNKLGDIYYHIKLAFEIWKNLDPTYIRNQE